jgi:hypothetical protein
MVYDAEAFLESLFRPGAEHGPPRDFTPADLPAEWYVVWGERAAIMEYDGGPPCERAEAAALAETLEEMRLAGASPAGVT